LNSNIQIIRYEECESSIWKNGGGSTKQLLIWPKGADLSNFDFRISIATISSDGPFSLFHGIDRQLCILEGEGVRLKIKGNDLGQSEEIVLRPNDPPFCFSGETKIESMLLDKKVLDFNVMRRSTSYNAYIEKIDCNGKITFSTFNEYKKTEGKNRLNTRKGKYQIIIFLSKRKVKVNNKKININRYDSLLLKNNGENNIIFGNNILKVIANRA